VRLSTDPGGRRGKERRNGATGGGGRSPPTCTKCARRSWSPGQGGACATLRSRACAAPIH